MISERAAFFESGEGPGHNPKNIKTGFKIEVKPGRKPGPFQIIDLIPETG